MIKRLLDILGAGVLLALVILLFTSPVRAQQQEAPTVAADPVLEKRVQKLGEELRCLVCQNQTIADSNAGLAVDLKNQIREQLKAGRSDRQILDYMVERYGDFVLYRPPVKATTVLLWAGPFVLFALGVGAAVVIVRRRREQVAAAPEITDEQRRKAAQLLQEEPEKQA
jgi:cytochrome c-type biogenesis protein CcmH